MLKPPFGRCLVIATFVLLLNVAFAAEPPAATSFVRVVRNADQQPAALQTATARYVAASGEGELVVDLIGVVHIGDKKYYRQLNKQFEQYDALLYELVAPPENRVPQPDRGSDNPLAMLHQLMNVALDLESQMKHIDYTKENFVHADLSPDEMAKAIHDRGDDQMTLMLGVAADFMRQQNLQRLRLEQQEADADAKPAEEFGLSNAFELLADPNRLKRIMAEQFADQGDPAAGIGKTLGQILIDDRNKAAMKVFQKQLAGGKTRIGIFYGAAHMPDFEQRLMRDFGLKRKSVSWQTAWDMKTAQTTGFERLFKLLDE